MFKSTNKPKVDIKEYLQSSRMSQSSFRVSRGSSEKEYGNGGMTTVANGSSLRRNYLVSGNPWNSSGSQIQRSLGNEEERRDEMQRINQPSQGRRLNTSQNDFFSQESIKNRNEHFGEGERQGHHLGLGNVGEGDWLNASSLGSQERRNQNSPLPKVQPTAQPVKLESPMILNPGQMPFNPYFQYYPLSHMSEPNLSSHSDLMNPGNSMGSIPLTHDNRPENLQKHQQFPFPFPYYMYPQQFMPPAPEPSPPADQPKPKQKPENPTNNPQTLNIVPTSKSIIQQRTQLSEQSKAKHTHRPKKMDPVKEKKTPGNKKPPAVSPSRSSSPIPPPKSPKQNINISSSIHFQQLEAKINRVCKYHTLESSEHQKELLQKQFVNSFLLNNANTLLQKITAFNKKLLSIKPNNTISRNERILKKTSRLLKTLWTKKSGEAQGRERSPSQ